MSRPSGTLIEDLRAEVRARAENRPGTYRMLGPAGELLYIGKSIRIRTRLLSYFRARPGEKPAEIIGHTHQIDWEYAPNEFAALVSEFRQIRSRRPIYNSVHKRDRAFAFVKLTNEAAPKLLVVSRPVADGASYYGPFRGRARLREAMRELSDLLELRDCASRTPINFADQPDLFGEPLTPLCIRAELARCLAPCAAGCTHSAYQEQAELARSFLEGGTEEPITILQERMQRAADRLDYEYAGSLRDRAQRLELVRADLTDLRDSVIGETCLYPVAGYNGEDRVYLLHRGLIRAEFTAPTNETEWAVLRERAHERLQGAGSASLQIEPGEAAEALLVARWFRLNPDERERVRLLGSGNTSSHGKLIVNSVEPSS